MSDSVRPHRRQPTRLPRPWDSPGKNTGVGCRFLLQCMKVKSESEVVQSCLTLSEPMDCSLPGSSIHGIFQARILEWDAIAFSDPWVCIQLYLKGILLPSKRQFCEVEAPLEELLLHCSLLTPGKRNRTEGPCASTQGSRIPFLGLGSGISNLPQNKYLIS